MINFCVVKVFMVLLETDTTWMEKFLEFMKCAYEASTYQTNKASFCH